jgi:hypothetical protein
MSSQTENQVVSPSSLPSSSSSASSFGLSSLNPFNSATQSTTIDDTAHSNDKLSTIQKTPSVSPPEMITLNKEYITALSLPLNDSKDYVCRIECIQHVEYHLNTMQTFKSHQLGLLDIILNNNSNLAVIISFFF